jgi:hypothetical protein
MFQEKIPQSQTQCQNQSIQCCLAGAVSPWIGFERRSYNDASYIAAESNRIRSRGAHRTKQETFE